VAKLDGDKVTPRVVLDTNVLVAAAYAPTSASRAIVEACLDGDLEAIVSDETVREYRYILGRAVRSGAYQERLEKFLSGGTLVVPERTPRHVPEDAEDDKFLAAALAGQAGWIVTNDHHLLDLDPYWEVRIVRPGEFAAATKLT
jgi:putative PIN family toxin of toxin-antitoxin system